MRATRRQTPRHLQSLAAFRSILACFKTQCNHNHTISCNSPAGKHFLSIYDQRKGIKKIHQHTTLYFVSRTVKKSHFSSASNPYNDFISFPTSCIMREKTIIFHIYLFLSLHLVNLELSQIGQLFQLAHIFDKIFIQLYTQ
jgi:hypothetical protein